MNIQRVAEGDRLRRVLEAKDVTQVELAVRLSAIIGSEITRSMVANYISGRTRLTESTKAHIAASLKMSVDDIWGPSARGGASVGGAASGNVSRVEETDAFSMTAAIPRWRSAIAGYSDEDSEFFQDGMVEVQVAFLVGGRAQIDRHDLVTVSGNSMAPRVNSGESLIVYRDETLFRNSIVLAQCSDQHGSKVFVKALRRVGEEWQLHSVNKAEGDDFKKLEDWKIFGYAICRLGDDCEDEDFNVEWRGGRPLRAVKSLVDPVNVVASEGGGGPKKPPSVN